MACNKDLAINMYFEEGLKPVEISKILNITKSAVTQILQKDIRYTKEKEIRKKRNIEKHKQYTKDYMKEKRGLIHFCKCSDEAMLRKQHIQDVKDLSKRNRLSDLAYREWNKSAFDYNSDKEQFEFKKELGRSYDVPKYIKITKV